jgi:hypothetical protein
VVTYTDADGIMAARPNEEVLEEGCKATRVMGMWQMQGIGSSANSTNSTGPVLAVYTYTLSAYCAVCDDHHDHHYEPEAAAAAN